MSTSSTRKEVVKVITREQVQQMPEDEYELLSLLLKIHEAIDPTCADPVFSGAILAITFKILGLPDMSKVEDFDAEIDEKEDALVVKLVIREGAEA